MKLRIVCPLVLAWLLTSCVSFDVVPVATPGCDVALTGHWLLQEAKPADQTLSVSDSCKIVATDSQGKTENGRFRTFPLDGYRYIALEENRSLQIKDATGKLVEEWPKRRVQLFRYDLEGDRVLLWAASTQVARALRAQGVTVRTDDIFDPKTKRPIAREIDGNVRLSGSRDHLADLLRRDGDALYRGMKPENAIVLRRAAVKDSR